MPSKSPNDWLKKIFSVGSLSLIIAIIGTIIAYKSLMADAGGSLRATFSPEGRELADHPTTIIAVNEHSATVLNDYLPTLTNPSENTLRDFVLHYRFAGDGYDVIPTGFFNVKDGADGQIFTYDSGVLGAGLTAEAPVKDLSVAIPGIVNMTVDITATFSGAPEPLRVASALHVLYVPHMEGRDAWYARVTAMAPGKTIQAYWSTSDSRRIGGETAATSTPAPISTPTASTETPGKSVDTSASNTHTHGETVTVSEKEPGKKSVSTWWLMLFPIGVFLFFCISVGVEGIFKTAVACKGDCDRYRDYFSHETCADYGKKQSASAWAAIYWYCGWLGVLIIIALVIFLTWLFIR